MKNNIINAIKIIQDNEPDDGYKLSFSGGKDSVVLYHLAQRAQVNFQSEFFNTTIEHPETYRFIRDFYPEITWLQPKTTFFQGILLYGLPHRKVRWCCNDLKKCHNHPNNVYLIGIRAAESWKRAQRYTNIV